MIDIAQMIEVAEALSVIPVSWLGAEEIPQQVEVPVKSG